MNGNPTAKQKKFHAWCRRVGCMVTYVDNPELHHIGGSKMKLKGCDRPGEWYVIPISNQWHSYYGKPNAIHANRKGFVKFWGKTEKELWIELIDYYEDGHGEKPMSEDEYNIIVDRA